MTVQTHTLDHDVPRLSAGRSSLTLAAAVVVAIAVNALVSGLARSSGAGSGFAPLTLPVYGAFTFVGILVGWVGWRLIRRRARRPGRLLGWLVPVLGALSFAPDVALGLTRFIPGATWSGVLGLMVMHVVVIAVAVPAYLVADRFGRLNPGEGNITR